MNKFDIDRLRGQTYATIRAAFNSSNEILEEYGDAGSCNITGILTRIIQDVGRFSERWSSDALYGMDHLRDLAGEHYSLRDQPEFDEIFTFGIRQDGVDHGSYVLCNLAKSRDRFTGYVFPKRDYRRVLAVRCRARFVPGLNATRAWFSFRDITNGFHAIETADLKDPKSDDIIELPLESWTSPEPQESRQTDKEDVRKAMEDGFKSFSLRPADGKLYEELAKQGCSGDFTCFEVLGYYNMDKVPADKNPGIPVCRVFVMNDKTRIAAWLQPEYAWYDEAKQYVESAGR